MANRTDGRTRSESISAKLEIDPLRLDVEWQNQPKLFHHYADRVAAAKRELDVAQNELEELRAILYIRIAKNPEKAGLPKATENAVNAAINFHEKFVEAKQRVVDAKCKVAELSSVVTALDHRKKALENLVKLHISDYGATPQAPFGEREALSEMKKKRGYRSRKVEELEEDEGDE